MDKKENNSRFSDEVLALVSPESEISLDDCSVQSNKKVLWRCEKHGDWVAQVKTIVNGTRCPVCANEEQRKPLSLVLKEFYSTENSVPFDEVFLNFKDEVSWVCPEGHSWMEKPITVARRKNVCKECYFNERKIKTLNKVKSGKPGRVSRSMKETHPELLKLIHPDDVLKASESSFRGMSAVRFICSEGHVSRVKPVNYRGFCKECDKEKRKRPVAEFLKDDRILSECVTEMVSSVSSNADWVCPENHSYTTTLRNRLKGSECPYCTNRKVLKGFNDAATTHAWALEFIHPDDHFLLERSTAGGLGPIRWICENGHESKALLYNRYRDKGCRECFLSSHGSKAENSVYEFLSQFVENIKRGDKTVLGNNQEVDFYLPDHNIAIEYNGLYWHSEDQGKDKFYHFNKIKNASKKGVTLLHIWEDDWRDRRLIVESLLKHRLGATDRPVVGARRTKIVSPPLGVVKDFLKDNHLQGFVGATHYLGLEFQGEVVAVMSVTKRKEFEWEIVRYATSVRVPGGFTKLLKFFVKMENPKIVFSFSDNSVSSGLLYQKAGFVRDYDVPPDYSYVIDGQRRHKFGFRKKRFMNDPNLLFEDGLTEKELAVLNGIPRVWDAGKVRWVLAF